MVFQVVLVVGEQNLTAQVVQELPIKVILVALGQKALTTAEVVAELAEVVLMVVVLGTVVLEHQMIIELVLLFIMLVVEHQEVETVAMEAVVLAVLMEQRTLAEAEEQIEIQVQQVLVVQE
jgi:hypothetical protein